LLDARNHYPITKHHTPPPRWSDNTTTTTTVATTRGVASGPNSVPAILPVYKRPLLLRTQPAPTTDDRAPHGPGKT
jgi:hypothetical protein